MSLQSVRPTARSLLVGLLTVTLLAIWAYVIARATSVAFTNDEAISYGIIHGAQTFVDTANNQWLNTQMMRVSQFMFGQSELALRLPNVAAFGLYGAATMVLLAHVQRLESKIAGFALLMVNPFLIEFFALARGYGLSLAFSAAAIACLVSERSSSSAWRELGRLALTGIFGLLAFYANFSALNIVLGLLTVEITNLFLSHPGRGTHMTGYRPAAAAVIGVTAAGLMPGIIQLRHLQALNQLYYGGHTSFIKDTIGSLLGSSSCGYVCSPSWLSIGETLVVVIVGLAIVWAAARYVRTRAWNNLQRVALLFVTAILAVLVESWLLGALYPIDRTALDYIVPFGSLVAFFIDDIARSVSSRPFQLVLSSVVGCFLLFTTINFAQDANVEKATIWTFDASSRQVINAILKFEQQHGRPSAPWKLIAGFPRNEALNYYRLRFKMTWLQPVTREPISTPNGDLYYVSLGEKLDLSRGTILLASFSDTGTQLRAASSLINKTPMR